MEKRARKSFTRAVLGAAVLGLGAAALVPDAMAEDICVEFSLERYYTGSECSAVGLATSSPAKITWEAFIKNESTVGGFTGFVCPLHHFGNDNPSVSENYQAVIHVLDCHSQRPVQCRLHFVDSLGLTFQYSDYQESTGGSSCVTDSLVWPDVFHAPEDIWLFYCMVPEKERLVGGGYKEPSGITGYYSDEMECF